MYINDVVTAVETDEFKNAEKGKFVEFNQGIKAAVSEGAVIKTFVFESLDSLMPLAEPWIR